MSECLNDFDLPKTQLPDVLKSTSAANTALCTLIARYSRDYRADNMPRLEGEEGRSVFLVLSGWLLLSKSLADGHRQIVDVILPGGLLEPASADLTTSAIDVEALTDCRLAAIPQQEWQRACDAHQEIVDLNHKVTAASFARLSERVLRLGKAPAESMIAYVLCELCLRSSAHGLTDGVEFHIPMTQQQLGDFCGLSAVHVCRTLRRLQRNGVLTVTDHMNILVHDKDAMAATADIDISALRNEIVVAA